MSSKQAGEELTVARERVDAPAARSWREATLPTAAEQLREPYRRHTADS